MRFLPCLSVGLALLLAQKAMANEEDFLTAPPLPNVIEWKMESLKSLTKNEKSWTLLFQGQTKFGHAITLDGQLIPLDRESRFQWRLALKATPEATALQWIGDQGDSETISIKYRWKKDPAALFASTKQTSAPAGDWLEIAWGPEEKQAHSESSWYGRIGVGGTLALEKDGGMSISPTLGWLPQIEIGEDLELRPYAISSLLKWRDSTYFVGLSYGFGLTRVFKPFQLEVGGGLSSWFSKDSTRPEITVGASLPLKIRALNFIERISVSYAHRFRQGRPTYLFRLGVVAAF